MAVQIPFPLPSHGFAQNSKMRVNLDFLVDTFNQFNTGTATWDTVAVGVANNSTGTVTFYNGFNSNYLTLQAGATSPSRTYTLPVATTTADGVLMSTQLGVMSWDDTPTLTSLETTGTITAASFVRSKSSLQIYNQTTGLFTGFTNAAGKPDVADLVYTLPPTLGNASDVLTVDGSGHMSWGAVSAAAASKALDNLASVAINTSLVSDTTTTDDLGSATVLWSHVYAKYGWFGKDAVAGEVRVYAPTTLKGYLSQIGRASCRERV